MNTQYLDARAKELGKGKNIFCRGEIAKALKEVKYRHDHDMYGAASKDRRLPEDPDLAWMGYSVGHWEGDTTFVVDTVGFNEKTWLDRLGHAHSDQLHVTERFRRVDHDHLELDITMTDPRR
jgi:hypothetical protein